MPPLNPNPHTPAQFRQLVDDIRKSTAALEAAIDANSADIAQNAIDIAQNAMDIAQNAADILSIQADYVSAASPFGTDDVLLASDGTDRGSKSTGIDKDDVVTSNSTFGTDDVLIVSDGTGKSVESSSIPAAEVVVDADITNMVTADSPFGTDNVLLRSNGADRISQNTNVSVNDEGQLALRDLSSGNYPPMTTTNQLDSSGWTLGANWSGNFASGFTHTGGSVATLSNSFTPTVGVLYHLQFTITGRTVGNFTISFGGLTGTNKGSLNATQSHGPRAKTTANIVFTPSSAFNGTISNIQLYEITGVKTAVFTVRDPGNFLSQEMRRGGATTPSSIFSIGVSAGGRITDGTFNFLVGTNAGLDLTSGLGNFIIGNNAGQSLTVENLNTIIGPAAAQSLTGGNSNLILGSSAASNANFTGSNSIFIGALSGSSITSGNANMFIGESAGFGAGQLSTAGNSLGIGTDVVTSANNQFVLGSFIISQSVLRGTVDIVRGSFPTRLNVYNTSATDPPGTSFELVAMRWDANVAKIGTHKGSGGGTARDFAIETDSIDRLTFHTDGTITMNTVANLPTSEPTAGGAGQVWLQNDGGSSNSAFLMVTTG